MSLQELQKLKQLIQISNLLSNPERAEWSQLLPLMNDKQLLELEKILTPAAPMPAVRTQTVTIQPLVQLPPVLPQEPKVLPKLSHIVNMPHIANDLALPVPKPSAVAVAQTQKISSQPPLKKNKFFDRLKLFLTEKELPAGKLERELELPVGIKPPVVESAPNPQISVQVISQTPPVEKKAPVVLPDTVPVIVPIIPVAPVRPTAPVSLSKVISPVNAPANNSQQLPSQQNVPPQSAAGVGDVSIHADQINITASQKSKPISQPASQQTAPAKPLISPDPEQSTKPVTIEHLRLEDIKFDRKTSGNTKTITSGLSVAHPPDKQTPFRAGGFVNKPSENKATVEEITKVNDVLSKPRSIPTRIYIASPMEIKSATDLTILDPKVWEGQDPNAAAEKIKTLIRSYGYHEIVFNLEKSPLFKAYLQTGNEILKQRGDFEALHIKKPADFLTRDSFEQFADLLRMIQAG